MKWPDPSERQINKWDFFMLKIMEYLMNSYIRFLPMQLSFSGYLENKKWKLIWIKEVQL